MNNSNTFLSILFPGIVKLLHKYMTFKKKLNYKAMIAPIVDPDLARSWHIHSKSSVLGPKVECTDLCYVTISPRFTLLSQQKKTKIKYTKENHLDLL